MSFWILWRGISGSLCFFRREKTHAESSRRVTAVSSTSLCEGAAEVYRKSELLSGLHAKFRSDRRTSIRPYTKKEHVGHGKRSTRMPLTLRKKFVEDPICLAFPAWDREVYIEADASLEGIAAVLSQKDDESGILWPINFFSSTLSSSQRNYSAGQLEAWALVAATKKWGVYLSMKLNFILYVIL